MKVIAPVTGHWSLVVTGNGQKEFDFT
jgi:hypothetical protein